jgi:hypothetical protein
MCILASEAAMKPRHLALTNQSSRKISLAELTSTAGALQAQLDRDFTPVWGVAATVIAFDANEKIPATFWPLRIVDKPAGGLPIHLTRNHQPFAQIKATSDWPVTASHEMLEMLVDPYGHKFISAPDITPRSDGHLVHYLLEVGDPCEAYSYTINGVPVSDFITPEYYNPHARSALDHLGRLTKSLEVPFGCYISWIDPVDGRWHQKTPDGSFVVGRQKANPKRNPRDDRDKSFPDEDERHDLSAIRGRMAKGSLLIMASDGGQPLSIGETTSRTFTAVTNWSRRPASDLDAKLGPLGPYATLRVEVNSQFAGCRGFPVNSADWSGLNAKTVRHVRDFALGRMS